MSNELLNKASELIEDVRNLNLNTYGSYGRDRAYDVLRSVEEFIYLHETNKDFTVEEFLDRLMEGRII